MKKEKEKRTEARVRAVDRAIQPQFQEQIFIGGMGCECGSCDCDHSTVRRSWKVGDVAGVYVVCHPKPQDQK